MLERIMEIALARRGLVLWCAVFLTAAGVWAFLRMPVDAFPDTSSIQVQVNTAAPALSGEEIEREITLPIEMAMGGLPGLVNVRSVSKFGLSQVVTTFTDETRIEDARQSVLERLSAVSLPEGVPAPQLGPISSGLGEVFAYLVRSRDPARSLDDLRTLHDWVIRPELLKTPGIAEVTAWGGLERQYEVIVSPEKLATYAVSLQEVIEAVRENNRNAGGGQVTQSGQALTVQGLGRVQSLDDIRAIVIDTRNGAPVRVSDVAEVAVGSEIRRGAVTAEGEGEAVLGLGYMLLGENSRTVARALRERLDAVRPALPEDVQLEVVYDRTELVDLVLDTVFHNLTAGAVMVIVVLFVLLGSLRAGLLVAVSIPMAMLCAVLGMRELSIAASLLSLGAIDFGLLVDGSVVVTDANLRALGAIRRSQGRRPTRAERMRAVIESSRLVARPVVFGMSVILIVFLPILTLEGAEGKMFRPLAWTFIFALFGALAVAMFVSPALSYFLLPAPKREEGGRILAGAISAYRRVLRGLLHARGLLLGGVAVLLALAFSLTGRLGGEFMPRLSEGAIVMNLIRLPGIALEESIEYNTRIERMIKQAFPNEVAHAWSRIGTAEVATDPMGTELSDLFLTLKPREQWTRAKSQAELVQAIEELLHTLPGQNIVFTQPIELRMNELTSGMRADIGVKIIGDDFAELERLAGEVQRALAEVPGSADAAADPVAGMPVLQVDVNEAAISRLGVPGAEVLEYVEALGGIEAGVVTEGQRRFPLAVRLPDALRQNPERLADTLIRTQSGAVAPFGQLAEVRRASGLVNINREWGRRQVRVQCNVRGRDIASFVEEAQARIAADVPLPEGYLLEWGGQFEHLERSQQRLFFVVPLALLLVFMLLYLSLGNFRDVLLVYSGIPFALVGGVFALYWRGMPFSISAAVGFIALCGIAVLNGQVLIAAIRNGLNEGLGLFDAVLSGAGQRLRPVLATSITDALGFLPMALSMGVGAEVQRPLATVVVAGVLSSTVLTLFVLPVLYWVVNRRSFPAEDSRPV